MTQLVLAGKSKVSVSKIWRFENGYGEPTPNEMKRLARVLKVPVEAAFPPSSEAIAS